MDPFAAFLPFLYAYLPFLTLTGSYSRPVDVIAGIGW